MCNLSFLKHRRSEQGFTLLELQLAMLLGSIILLSCFHLLSSVLGLSYSIRNMQSHHQHWVHAATLLQERALAAGNPSDTNHPTPFSYNNQMLTMQYFKNDDSPITNRNCLGRTVRNTLVQDDWWIVTTEEASFTRDELRCRSNISGSRSESLAFDIHQMTFRFVAIGENINSWMENDSKVTHRFLSYNALLATDKIAITRVALVSTGQLDTQATSNESIKIFDSSITLSSARGNRIISQHTLIPGIFY